MTKSLEPKEEKKPFESSRQWAEKHLEIIKGMQDEYLDRYYDDRETNDAILSLLTQLVDKLEKQL